MSLKSKVCFTAGRHLLTRFMQNNLSNRDHQNKTDHHRARHLIDILP